MRDRNYADAWWTAWAGLKRSIYVPPPPLQSAIVITVMYELIVSNGLLKVLVYKWTDCKSEREREKPYICRSTTVGVLLVSADLAHLGYRGRLRRHFLQNASNTYYL